MPRVTGAGDGYEAYFAEKIWAMIPEIYRHEDGLGEDPGVLRALVEVLARQATIVRRSHDRLWEDRFIELCDDWAVPYIGELVGTRLVSALNLRGRRVDVAKTIYYRRRKGTLAVLEELIGDIAGWEGTVVEEFRRLGRARHRLDPPPGRERGPWTGTPPGGWADLRSARLAELAGSPFDELHYTPDVRRHRGRDGRYAIPKIAFHLYRLRPHEITGSEPAAPFGLEGALPGEGRRAFTFDPSGRDVPLFMRRSRPQDPATPAEPARWDRWRPAREWELPGPMRCRLLGRSPDGDGSGGPAERAREHLLGVASASGVPPEPAVAVLQGTEPEPVAEVPEIAGARLDGWTTTADEELVIEPERGRFLLGGETPADGLSVRYVYGFAGPVGAGPYARPHVEDRVVDSYHSEPGDLPGGDLPVEGVAELRGSSTFVLTTNKLGIRDLTLQAGNFARPYLRLGGDGDRVLRGRADARLVLDGVWVGPHVESEPASPRSLVLRGDYERVTLRHVTLDPGGPARIGEAGRPRIPAVPLRVEASVELLEIDSAITGPIVVENGSVEQIRVRDSILQRGLEEEDDDVALRAGSGEVVLERVTCLGGLDVRRLWATETLITGSVGIADLQTGCFRFGAAGPEARLPHPYESHRIEPGRPLFDSRRFGDPDYARLARSAPEEILRGAENGSEIGAWSSLLEPIKRRSLRAKVEEYLPFGRIPIFIDQT